jgi:hypothetical protein
MLKADRIPKRKEDMKRKWGGIMSGASEEEQKSDTWNGGGIGPSKAELKKIRILTISAGGSRNCVY